MSFQKTCSNIAVKLVDNYQGKKATFLVANAVRIDGTTNSNAALLLDTHISNINGVLTPAAPAVLGAFTLTSRDIALSAEKTELVANAQNIKGAYLPSKIDLASRIANLDGHLVWLQK